MELNVKTLEGKDAGKVSLSDEIFGLDPRQDILARMVRWQLAKKQPRTGRKFPVPVPRCTSRRVRAALVTIRLAHRSSAAAARPTARSFAATPMTFPRRFVRSLCVTLCLQS